MSGETLAARRSRLAAHPTALREVGCACGAAALAVPDRAAQARCALCHSAGVSASLPVQIQPGAPLVQLLARVPLRAPEAVVQRVEHPAPEFVCLDGCPHEQPGPVETLAGRAQCAGWAVELLHSRGTGVGVNGRPLAVADYWSVRFRSVRGGEHYQGFAVRRGLLWDTVGVVGGGRPPFMKLGVTELGEWLIDPARPDDWFAEVARRRAAQALAARQLACPGPGLCEWVDGQRGDHSHRGDGAIKPRTARVAVEHGG